MTRLSDTQTIMLSTAAQHESGSLLPLPSTLKAGGGTSKAVAALIKQGLAEERETPDVAASRQVNGDIHYGVFITAAGEAAIGVEREQDASESRSPATASTPAEVTSAAVKAASPTKALSKSASVIIMLTRPDGATLPELIEATGWLPHTTRAALTGIRKKGHEITRGKRDGATCYRILEAA